MTIYEVEERFCRFGWFNPVELNDIGFLLGLRGTDFADSFCGNLYTYLWLCADRDVTPSKESFFRAMDSYPRAAVDTDLYRIFAATGCTLEEFEDFGRRIQTCAVDRGVEDVRYITRNSLKRIARGLKYGDALEAARCNL